MRVVAASFVTLALLAPAAGAGTLSVLYQASSLDGGAGGSLDQPLPVAGGGVVVETTGGGGADPQLILLTPDGKKKPYARTELHDFTGSCTGDGTPSGTLVPDKAGDVWGMTNSDGACPGGIVFEVVRPATGGAWTYREVLAMPSTFPGGNYGDMAFSPKGDLFGLLNSGAYGAGCPEASCGTVFEIPAAALSGGSAPVKTLYTVPKTGPGAYPAGLSRDRAGDLFFATYEGGSVGMGAIWEVTPPSGKGGVWTGGIIHSFCTITDQYDRCPDGWGPEGAPAVDANGALYGTSYWGGAGPQSGNGVIWFMQPPFVPGTNTPVSVIHELYSVNNGGVESGDVGIGQPFGDTLLSKQGQVITLLTQGGEVGAPTNQGVPNGGVLSVSPQTGADAIVSNAFAAFFGVQNGPEYPDTNLGMDAKGDLYGSSQAYYTASTNQFSPAVIFKITP